MGDDANPVLIAFGTFVFKKPSNHNNWASKLLFWLVFWKPKFILDDKGFPRLFYPWLVWRWVNTDCGRWRKSVPITFGTFVFKKLSNHNIWASKLRFWWFFGNRSSFLDDNGFPRLFDPWLVWCWVNTDCGRRRKFSPYYFRHLCLQKTIKSTYLSIETSFWLFFLENRCS